MARHSNEGVGDRVDERLFWDDDERGHHAEYAAGRRDLGP